MSYYLSNFLGLQSTYSHQPSEWLTGPSSQGTHNLAVEPTLGMGMAFVPPASHAFDPLQQVVAHPSQQHLHHHPTLGVSSAHDAFRAINSYAPPDPHSNFGIDPKLTLLNSDGNHNPPLDPYVFGMDNRFHSATTMAAYEERVIDRSPSSELADDRWAMDGEQYTQSIALHVSRISDMTPHPHTSSRYSEGDPLRTMFPSREFSGAQRHNRSSSTPAQRISRHVHIRHAQSLDAGRGGVTPPLLFDGPAGAVDFAGSMPLPQSGGTSATLPNIQPPAFELSKPPSPFMGDGHMHLSAATSTGNFRQRTSPSLYHPLMQPSNLVGVSCHPSTQPVYPPPAVMQLQSRASESQQQASSSQQQPAPLPQSPQTSAAEPQEVVHVRPVRQPKVPRTKPLKKAAVRGETQKKKAARAGTQKKVAAVKKTSGNRLARPLEVSPFADIIKTKRHASDGRPLTSEWSNEEVCELLDLPESALKRLEDSETVPCMLLRGGGCGQRMGLDTGKQYSEHLAHAHPEIEGSLCCHWHDAEKCSARETDKKFCDFGVLARHVRRAHLREAKPCPVPGCPQDPNNCGT
ncbi:hypothetical protein FISHEDRAFT_75250 [Fistulina hepatica ATCC 64428]|uniref:Uncharacterized protein n=1 Tax=Fistulina hepatica ATCC 64428 TaxID=1128425 RepID=A0A0D7A7V5_9AGAR|nr:hypothetical protein FISHEDRAFT_75250 [Fistulina hepatica ATCC 64428]